MIYLPGFAYLNLHQTRIISILDEKVNDLSRKMVIFIIYLRTNWTSFQAVSWTGGFWVWWECAFLWSTCICWYRNLGNLGGILFTSWLSPICCSWRSLFCRQRIRQSSLWVWTLRVRWNMGSFGRNSFLMPITFLCIRKVCRSRQLPRDFSDSEKTFIIRNTQRLTSLS